MSKKRLTYKQAVAGLERAVREKGEGYTYERVGGEEGACAYFDPETKEPSCIVGHVFSYMGFTYEDIAALETGSSDPNLWSVSPVTDGLLDDLLAESTRRLLVEAQYLQDRGEPWGEALKGAKRVARGR